MTPAEQAWRIARKHVPYFETTWAPNRNAILAAVTEALKTTPPKESESCSASS